MLSKRLRTREIDGRDCKRHCARQRFSHFKLQQSHDTHDPDAANLRLSFLRRRSKIVEIVSGGDIVCCNYTIVHRSGSIVTQRKHIVTCSWSSIVSCSSGAALSVAAAYSGE